MKLKDSHCHACQEYKPLSDFYIRKDTGKPRAHCRACWIGKTGKYTKENRERLRPIMRKYAELYRKEKPWVSIYSSIPNRIKIERTYKNIKRLISVEEVKKLWFRDMAYAMKKPSIDRINNDGDYTFDNCRFIELVENIRRSYYGNGITTPVVVQYDFEGNFINEFPSVQEASRKTKISAAGIYSVIKGKYVRAGNYFWGLVW